MASVEDFLRALDSIEAEIREVPDVVFVEMSLTRGRIEGDTSDTIDTSGRYILLLTSRSVRAHWEGLCFDIGGPEFPFVWSLKSSEVYESFPKELELEREPVEFAVWYYLDSWRNPVPDRWLDKLPPDEEDHHREDGLAAMVYRPDMERAFNVMRSVKTAWSLAPETVVRKFGDVSKLPIGPALPAGVNDDFDLWWPAVLLHLALRKFDVILSASAAEHVPFDSIFDDLPEGGDHRACIDAFEPTTLTVSLSPPSLLAATSCALRAFRRAAEDSAKKPATVTAGAGRPAAADTPATTSDDAPNPAWDRTKGALAARFDRVLSALRGVIATETALDPAWEETKKGVEGAFADSLCARSRERTTFENETPTMDALVINLKDNCYKDPSWPSDGADDAQMLRSVWHFIHDTIGAGKPFAPDDLSVMRNLGAALERARERLTEPEPLTVTPSGAKFQWKPPMLEGYVRDLLKEIEYPKEREATEWIAAKSGKPEPARATLRKTYYWQNRPQKIPKPRTTNEAQSGVSPAENADAVVSHEEVTNAVLDIEEILHRQLVDNERDAVAWTLDEAGADEEKRDEAIAQLIQGFKSGDM
ncbi:MAG: hypothetical protein IT422_22545 [Pirellulaceae bacterium]|nr:hypothetical protein [Pirellulaceae bacterium]